MESRTHPKSGPYFVDMISLSPFVVGSGFRGIGSQKEIEHGLEDTRGCYGGGDTAAGRTIRSAVLMEPSIQELALLVVNSYKHSHEPIRYSN